MKKKQNNDDYILVYSSEWGVKKEEIKKPKKYHDFYLTDIQYHVQKPANSLPITRQMEKSIKSGKPGRAYTSIKKDKKGKTKNDFDFTSHAKRLAKNVKNGEIIRFWEPKKGLKESLGKDAKEFLKAHPEIITNLTRKK